MITSRLWDPIVLDQIVVILAPQARRTTKSRLLVVPDSFGPVGILQVTLAPSPKNASVVAKSKLRPRAQPTEYPPIGPVIRHLGKAGW